MARWFGRPHPLAASARCGRTPLSQRYAITHQCRRRRIGLGRYNTVITGSTSSPLTTTRPSVIRTSFALTLVKPEYGAVRPGLPRSAQGRLPRRRTSVAICSPRRSYRELSERQWTPPIDRPVATLQAILLRSLSTVMTSASVSGVNSPAAVVVEITTGQSLAGALRNGLFGLRLVNNGVSAVFSSSHALRIMTHAPQRSRARRHNRE